MTIHEAIEAVASIYVPGVAAHYARQNPDPWEQMHEDFEEVLRASPFNEIAGKLFVERARELVQAFERNAVPPRGVSIADAANMTPERLSAFRSIKYQECYRCESQEGLSLETYGPDALQVRVVCPECRR